MSSTRLLITSALASPIVERRAGQLPVDVGRSHRIGVDHGDAPHSGTRHGLDRVAADSAGTDHEHMTPGKQSDTVVAEQQSRPAVVVIHFIHNRQNIASGGRTRSAPHLARADT